ncbi:hypothetical protein [Streptomyces sp. NPDC055749]
MELPNVRISLRVGASDELTEPVRKGAIELAFSAAGLSRDVAFEVTTADFMARLAGRTCPRGAGPETGTTPSRRSPIPYGLVLSSSRLGE